MSGQRHIIRRRNVDSDQARRSRVDFEETMEWVVRGFEIAGVAILVVGSLLAFASAAAAIRRVGGRAAYERARKDVGRFCWAWRS